MPSPQFVGRMWSDFTTDMTASMVSAMRATIRADEVAARSGGLGIVNFARSSSSARSPTPGAAPGWAATTAPASPRPSTATSATTRRARRSRRGRGSSARSRSRAAWRSTTPPPEAADPGHVAIVQDSGSVISQGGPEGVPGPVIQALRFLPLLFTGIPPGGFPAAAAAAPPRTASSTCARWRACGSRPGGSAATPAHRRRHRPGRVWRRPERAQPQGPPGSGRSSASWSPGNIFNPSSTPRTR